MDELKKTEMNSLAWRERNSYGEENKEPVQKNGMQTKDKREWKKES